jgi:hypothetical protein
MSKKRTMDRYLTLVVTVCIFGVSLATLAKSPIPQKRQPCGDTQTIWQNTTSDVKTVTATFTANCNESEEQGKVDIYDNSTTQVFTISFKKGNPHTFTFDVPANGHIDYLCTPRHNDADDQCTSRIDKVEPKSAHAVSKP